MLQPQYARHIPQLLMGNNWNRHLAKSSVPVPSAPPAIVANGCSQSYVAAMGKTIRETDLYAPIKRLLEGQGYEVKGEVGSADVVGCRDADGLVVVELKTGFSLSLFHQAVARQAVTDTVYVAVPRGHGRPFQKALKNNLSLCRRLGVGLITVRLEDGLVDVHADPAPFKPRKSKVKQTRLLREFARRVGDPNTGGTTRSTLMTAYRQDALRCLQVLHRDGPTKAAKVAATSAVTRARRIMADNHYGWFERVETGVYGLTPNGTKAVKEFAKELKRLKTAKPDPEIRKAA